MKFLLLLPALMLCPLALSAESPRSWDYDRVSREVLTEWRYLGVESADAPLPRVEPQRLAVVALPWQVELTRPMAFWLLNVRIPDHFAGRDVWLEVTTNAPARIFVNWAKAAEGPGGVLRALLAKAGQTAGSLELVVACTHGAKEAARFESAALMAEPAGLSAASQRFEKVFGTFADLAYGLDEESWAHCLRGPDEASQPGFDDSQWERGTMQYKWYAVDTHCWYRARLKVPGETAGVATQGRRLGLRARFNDHGRLFLDGTELMPNVDGTYVAPANLQPGQEVLIAARVLNDKSKGQLDHVQWRMIELDALEAKLLSLGEQSRKSVRTIGLHDRPKPEWVPQLDAISACLEAASKDAGGLAQGLAAAQLCLDRLVAAMAPTPIIIVPPYLQDLRQDGVTVMWETSAPAASWVEYGKEKLNKKSVEAASANTIHKIALTGLRPGTTYRYRVVSCEQMTNTFEFHTAPAKPVPFAFLVWSDDQTNFVVSGRVCAQMAKAQADFVVSTGDVVGCGGNWWEWTEQYLLPIHQWAPWRPSFVAIGNHEYGNPKGPERGVVAFEKYLTHPYAKGQAHNDYWYSFDYGNAHFICLDSQTLQEKDMPDGQVRIPETDPQLIWLKEDLKKAKSAEWLFVFFHKPPYSECWSGGYYDGEAHFRADLVPLLEEAQVAIVFSGHMHGYERGLPHPPYDPATGKGNNTAYIVAGGGGGGLDNHKYKEWEQTDVPDHPAVADSNAPDGGRFYKHHFCRVSVDGKRADFEAREVLPDGRDGGVFDRFTLMK